MISDGDEPMGNDAKVREQLLALLCGSNAHLSPGEVNLHLQAVDLEGLLRH